jgi:hypothetical protein
MFKIRYVSARLRERGLEGFGRYRGNSCGARIGLLADRPYSMTCAFILLSEQYQPTFRVAPIQSQPPEVTADADEGNGGMRNSLVTSGLAASISALIAVVAVAYPSSSSAAKLPPLDIKFSKNTRITIATGATCPAGTTAPCDVVILRAPFTCVDCALDFKNVFTAGGNAVTVGFVAPGGQCPSILGQGTTTGTTYSVNFASLNVSFSSPTQSNTIYEGTVVFQVSGANVFTSAIIDIQGKSGALTLTGSGDFSSIVGITPVSVFVRYAEPIADKDDPKSGIDIDCVDIAPVYGGNIPPFPSL